MAKFAVIKAGGKQYLVKAGQEIVVDKLDSNKKEIEVETLAVFSDEETPKIDLGTPALKKGTKAKILENLKGDKIRVARFKSKVRYRKVRGFRPQLSKIKILEI
jgi:large subunit ribosomal protein L21